MRRIEFNTKNMDRGSLARQIGKILGRDVKYLPVPTCNYDIGGCILDKEGRFYPTDDVEDVMLQAIAELLHGKPIMDEGSKTNRQPEEQQDVPQESRNENDTLCVSVSASLFDDKSLENLQNIVNGKSTLLQHAFGIEQLEIIISETKISFPWFPLPSNADAVAAYTAFISQLCDLARKVKKLIMKNTHSDVSSYDLALLGMTANYAVMGLSRKAKIKGKTHEQRRNVKTNAEGIR